MRLMFKGNIDLKIERLSGFDAFGQPSVSGSTNARCSIVRLYSESLRTSVRTDTSATGGNAHEMIADARLLIDIKTDISEGDRLTVQGQTLRVMQIFARNDVHGRPHHHQVDCVKWA